MLTQLEADALLAMEKRRENNNQYIFPDFGGYVSISLVSMNEREQFFLDLRRSRIALSKSTYQNRVRQVFILARLDIGSAPHRNPDGEEIQSPHLHLYKEGYGDKWAFPVPNEHFSNLADSWKILHEFMDYCNIVDPPNIQRGLFH